MNENATVKYLFLRIYSNDELQAYLSDMLQKGWVIDHCKGNFLFFRKQRITGARLCVTTTECNLRVPKGDEQVDETIEIAKKKGWQLLCIGDVESVLPMRRRIYLYTQDDNAQPIEPDEVIDFQYGYRAYHSTLRLTIFWALLCAAALWSTISFMLLDGVHFAFLVIDASALTIALSSLLLFLDRKALYQCIVEETPPKGDAYLRLRSRETLMIGGLIAMAAGIVLMLF